MTLQRGSAKIILTQNLVWATVCVALAFFLISLITTNNRLEQQARQLQQQVTSLHEPVCAARDVWKAGTSKKFSVETNGTIRSYLVQLPIRFNPNKTYPAVVYFPGKGNSAAEAEKQSGYNQLPVVAIYPEPTIGKDGVYSWQGAPYSSGENDVAFVGRMLDQVEAQLCIKRSHIYAVGISNGGGMVSLLSCQLPERIRAFGMIAGAYYPQSSCKPERPAPIITIHGDSDMVVPYYGSPIRKLPDIDQWSLKRAAQNSCKPTPFISHQSLTVTATWSNCRNGATVKLVRQIGVGHSWTMSDRDIMWKFLSSY